MRSRSAWKAIDLLLHLFSHLCPSGSYCELIYIVYNSAFFNVCYMFLLCRVYVGNSAGEQTNYFGLALAKVIHHLGCLGFPVQEETLTLTAARRKKFSVADIVNWLLGSHVHFVITHPNQGLWSSGGCVEEIYSHFSRLKFHPGFPMGAQIHCPMFTQNKWTYLKHLSALSIHQTCRLDMPPEGEDLQVVECAVRR